MTFLTASAICYSGNRSPAGSRWRSLVPQADALAGNPEAFANACYSDRMGNSEPGDSFNSRDRGGLKQETGRAN